MASKSETSLPTLTSDHIYCLSHNATDRLMCFCATPDGTCHPCNSGLDPFRYLWFHSFLGPWCSPINCFYLTCALACRYRLTVLGPRLLPRLGTLYAAAARHNNKHLCTFMCKLKLKSVAQIVHYYRCPAGECKSSL